MDKFILQTKNRYIIFVLIILSTSAITVTIVDNYDLKDIFFYVLITLSGLFAFYSLCKSKHKCVINNLRGIFESKIAVFRKSVFCYALALNVGLWTLFLIVLHIYRNSDSDTIGGYVGGVVCIFVFLFILFISKYSSSTKFVYNLKPTSKVQDKSLDIRALFLNDESYLSFVRLLRQNKVYEKFNSNMQFKVAVIMKANSEDWFSKYYLVKDLKPIIVRGRSYLDKPNLYKHYIDKDLDFINRK